MKKDWYKNQPRGGSAPYRFSPKWRIDTIRWIMAKLSEDIGIADIQYQLVKDYGIGLASALQWVKMSQRIQASINEGLSIESAIERDRVFRNESRRKKSHAWSSPF